MMLGTKGRYAVMSLVDMAAHNGHLRPIVLADISARQAISVRYLEQIFFKLRKAIIVNSQKGPGGGYILARAPDDILIYEIIQSVEEGMKMVRCNHTKSGYHACTTTGVQCSTHHLWAGMENVITDYLKSISLSDVMRKAI